jgi:uncharacterized membrane protein
MTTIIIILALSLVGMRDDPMLNFTTALEQLRATMTDAAAQKMLSPAILELEEAALVVDQFPDSFVAGIVELLGDSRFLDLKNSWKLLYFISNSWDQFSAEQRERLRGILANSFDKYADWMGAFITAEIFGEHYADAAALSTFVELAREARLPARTLVPHGLECLARTTQEKSLRDRAMSQLRELAQSDTDEIRQESVRCLQKLKVGQ